MRTVTLPVAVFAALICSGAVASDAQAQSAKLVVRLDGVELPRGRVHAFAVDSSPDSPDAASLVLASDRNTSLLGRSIEIAASDGAIFKGEIVAIEPIFEASGVSKVTVRAFNTLHRLARDRRTRVFEGLSDGDIVRLIASEAGLAAAVSGDVMIQHDYVYQHNQTDLEFLLERAARIGNEVFADNTTLHFRRRRETRPIIAGCGFGDVRLTAFRLWLSPPQATEVTVRGWDAVGKEEVVGRASQPVIALSAAAAQAEVRVSTFDLGVIAPLQGAEASHAAAKGTLSAITRQDFSGEIATAGMASLRPGALVTIDHAGAPFEGTYVVTKASHRFDRRSSDGYQTFARLLRHDRALFLLPEVGDQVLVAFEYGDVSRPIIVGSLWNPGERPAEDPCRPGRN